MGGTPVIQESPGEISRCARNDSAGGLSRILFRLLLAAMFLAAAGAGAAWAQGTAQGDQQAQRPLQQGGFFERLRSLSPAEQEQSIANDPVFRSLPAWRQRVIRARLRRWNALTPEQQQEALSLARLGWFGRLRDLPPERQNWIMAHNPRFQRLPLWRQRLIRRRLRRWNAMPPPQRQAFEQRQRQFNSMTHEQRQQARRVYPEWQRLPPARRQALMEAFRRLRDLPPDQRENFLASPEVTRRFSPQEQHILRGLGLLLPESPEGKGGRPPQ